MNSSSPIRINEATADELCTLDRIGEKRAARIIRYRTEVEPIRSVEALATAAGITYQQATKIADEIDWGNSRPPTHADRLPGIVSLGACGAIITYSLMVTGLDMNSASAILYNVSVIFILAGCAFTITDIVLAGSTPLTVAVRIAAISTWSTGVALLAALIIKAFISDADDAFSIRILTSWKFAVYVAIVVLLQLGPWLVMRFGDDHIEWLAFVYDFGQLPLVVVILLLTPLGSDSSLLEEIFCIWAGVVFLFNGRQLAHGRSSFVGMLSDTDRAVLAFLIREEDATFPDMSTSTRAQRITGITLAAMGSLLTIVAALEWLLASFPGRN